MKRYFLMFLTVLSMTLAFSSCKSSSSAQDEMGEAQEERMDEAEESETYED